MKTSKALILHAGILFAAFSCGACSEEESCPGSAQVDLAPTDDGIEVKGACGGVEIDLLPVVHLDDGEHGGGNDGPCIAGPDDLRCPAGPAGTVRAMVEENRIRVSFEASSDATVLGICLEGRGAVEGAASFLSNGFQSWSQSGMVALQPPFSHQVVSRALTVQGDTEVMRTGKELSWFYTVVGGKDAVFLAGALEARPFKPWIQASDLGGGELAVKLCAGRTGEEVTAHTGEIVEGETWFIGTGTSSDTVSLMESYSLALPSRRSSFPHAAEAGWNSWYELFAQVDEQDIRDNAALARTILSPYLSPGVPIRIVVDDGWQLAWGDWHPNAKFPSGLDGLAADLHGDGFKMGVWLAPLLVAEDQALVSDHPDWFVEGASYNHLENGPMRVLDPTHPDAAGHLQEVIGRIVSWGYSLLKIDFLFAGTYEGQRHEDVTGMEAYDRALALIREAAGEDTILLAVGAPCLPTFEHVDAWRIGADIALPMGPSWAFVVNQARSISARWHLCHATLCDADPVLLRTLPRNEVEAGAWVVAFAGGAFFLSDDLPQLPVERYTWGLDSIRVEAGLSAGPSIPLDIFPKEPPLSLVSALVDHIRRENSHVLPRIWRVPDTGTVLFNPDGREAIIDSTAVPARSAVLIE